MTPTLRMKGISARAVAEPAGQHDVSGLAEYRTQAARALEQTRAARSSGEIAKAADDTVKQIENGVTGTPEAGPEGTIAARIVASPDSSAKLPALPLSGLVARLKVNNEVVAENDTNAFGIVDFNIPKGAEGSYEIEVLAPDCSVLVCQTGKWDAKHRNPAHLIETPRSDRIKSQIERAKPLEQGILKARERAEIVREAAVKALDEQEKLLVEYLEKIDAELRCRSEEAEKEQSSDKPVREDAATEAKPAEAAEEKTPKRRRRSDSDPKSK